MREATLIRLPYGYGLQLDDRSPNAKPDKLPVAIAAFEHFIASPGCDDLGIGPVLADQQIAGSPDVAIGDHSGCRSKSILLPVMAETLSCLAFDCVACVLWTLVLTPTASPIRISAQNKPER